MKVWLDAQLPPQLCDWLTTEFGLDFADLVAKHGAPPQVIWLSCGNSTNRALRTFLAATLRNGIVLLERGEPLVRLVEALVSRT